ncbi:unnamed protein product [Vicia faba]|uniref:Uncharacterized protein n=1 Tax=Vicia faba TaxID=3906 RepID=A0AAV0Z799_VICFA|nr:unnamed protein product [Vicia faba]
MGNCFSTLEQNNRLSATVLVMSLLTLGVEAKIAVSVENQVVLVVEMVPASEVEKLSHFLWQNLMMVASERFDGRTKKVSYGGGYDGKDSFLVEWNENDRLVKPTYSRLTNKAVGTVKFDTAKKSVSRCWCRQPG